MNGGIILARIKVGFNDVVKLVNQMDCGDFDSTQLAALKEFLPSDEETGALKNYLSGCGSSEKSRNAAIECLGACEQYMVATFAIIDPNGKFETMSFKTTYEEKLNEILDP